MTQGKLILIISLLLILTVGAKVYLLNKIQAKEVADTNKQVECTVTFKMANHLVSYVGKGELY